MNGPTFVLSTGRSGTLALQRFLRRSKRVEAFHRYRGRRDKLCIVKTAPPTKSRTYAPLEFRAEAGETPALCSTLLSSSSHLASVSFG